MECILYSSDVRTGHLVRTAVAALGLGIIQEANLPECYPGQGLLLIATDLVPSSIPTRCGILLLDLEADVSTSSGLLVGMLGDDREVITELANQIAESTKTKSSAQLISITSAGGGLGLTTLVALLGLVLAREKKRILLIDQSERLLRILGSKGISISTFNEVPETKVGVLASDMVLTAELASAVRSGFDFLVLGSANASDQFVNPAHSLHITTNTALAVEQSSSLLSDSKTCHVLVRSVPHGSFSLKQVKALLEMRPITEWPDDANLSLAADLGDLGKAKSAIDWASRIWSQLEGNPLVRRN